MRRWQVAGALIHGPVASADSGHGVLLVQNRRKNGTLDWTPPGGVVEAHQGEAILDGLEREVREETGLVVTSWAGRAYRVVATAPGLGWEMSVEVHIADGIEGDLVIGNDPDGIVVAADYFGHQECDELTAPGHRWVRDPLMEWFIRANAADMAKDAADEVYRYRVEGSTPGSTTIHRIS